MISQKLVLVWYKSGGISVWDDLSSTLHKDYCYRPLSHTVEQYSIDSGRVENVRSGLVLRSE